MIDVEKSDVTLSVSRSDFGEGVYQSDVAFSGRDFFLSTGRYNINVLSGSGRVHFDRVIPVSLGAPGSNYLRSADNLTIR